VAEKAEARQAELKKQAAETGKIVAEKNAELSMLGIEAEAMQNRAHLQKAFIRHQEKIAVLSREIDEMRMQMAADESLSDALEQYSEDVEQGRRGGGRSHLQRPQLPASSAGMRFSRIAEAWAAASIGLAMIAFVGIVFFAPQYLLSGVAAIVVVIAVIEATFRRRLNRLINVLSGLLAFAASIVLLIEFFWTILIVSILLAGSYILLQNLREVWR
jgi:hypothetical protein